MYRVAEKKYFPTSFTFLELKHLLWTLELMMLKKKLRVLNILFMNMTHKRNLKK